MPEKIKVAIVNYLNTKPFIQGLSSGRIKPRTDLIECIPADCARFYLEGKVDLSLVPVGALVDALSIDRISDFGIASDGPVASVCILSDVPIESVKAIYLDYQSRTSVLLTKVLLQNYWHLAPVFLNSDEGYETKIMGEVAGLVIGDRALEFKSNHAYVYDLGEIWKAYTGLPFVYAIWLKTHRISPEYLDLFNLALQEGVDEIGNLLLHYPVEQRAMLTTYFNQNIRYRLNTAFDQGLSRFIQEVRGLNDQQSHHADKIRVIADQ